MKPMAEITCDEFLVCIISIGKLINDNPIYYPMSYKLTLMTVTLASFIAIGFIVQDAYAPTKIVPTDATPPHPFTIIDTWMVVGVRYVMLCNN